MLAEWSAGWDYIWEMRGMAQNWWAGNLAYLANNKRIIFFCLLPFCVHNLMPRGLKGVRFTFVAQNAHCLLGLEGSLWRCWTLILLMLRDDMGRQESMGRIQKITPFLLASVNFWMISSMWGSGSCSQPLPAISFSFSSSVNLSLFLPSV